MRQDIAGGVLKPALIVTSNVMPLLRRELTARQLEGLIASGIPLCDLRGPFDTREPVGQLTFQVLLELLRAERAFLAERVQARRRDHD
jgi:DNA invertase Pin-like site-specific DNA recombinase